MITSDEVLKRMTDRPYEAIIRMFLMVSITFIVIRVNGFLDTYWISHLSTEASAAVSLVNPIYSIVSALGLGVGSGVCVCISYRLGQHDYETANRMAGTAMVIGLVVSIPAILFLILGTDMMFTFVDKEVIRGLTREYVLPLAIGAPALIIAGIVTNFLKSEGAMRSMTFCCLVSIPVNALLTPVFVYTCGWGISGASAATVLGSLTSIIVGLLILRTGRFHIRPKIIKPTSAHVKEVLGIGFPKTIEGFLGGLTILVQNMVLLYNVGADCVAIHGIALSMVHLFTVISDSMGAAAQPVCSIAAGSRRIESMKRSMMFSAAVVIVLSIIVVIALELFAPQAIQLYTEGAVSELEDNLVIALEVYALMLPFFLLRRLASTLMQVLRKSYVWTPTYLLLIFLNVLLVSLFANDMQSMLITIVLSYTIPGIVACIMTVYYSRRYDPDVIETMIEKGKATPFRVKADPERPEAS